MILVYAANYLEYLSFLYEVVATDQLMEIMLIPTEIVILYSDDSKIHI